MLVRMSTLSMTNDKILMRTSIVRERGVSTPGQGMRHVRAETRFRSIQNIRLPWPI